MGDLWDISVLKDYLNAQDDPAVRNVLEVLISQLSPGVSISHHHHLKFLWHPDRVERFLKGDVFGIRPVTAEFVPSLECDYSCPHCTYSSWKGRTSEKRGSRLMGRDDMIDLLVSLKGGGLEGVIFTGGGEPFYNSHTVDGIELARDLGMGVGVFTNGSLLDQDAISRISNCADFIRLSINAVSEGRYLNFHGIHDASLLESVKKNVLRLAQARTHNGHASFGLGVIVDENNVDDLVPVASFASEVVKTTGGGIDYVGFRPVVDYWHGGNVISSRLVHKIRDYEVEVRRILSQAGIVPFFAFDYFSDASSCAERPKEYSKCLANPWAVSCAYDGTLYLCSENDGNPDYALGNLLRSSFDEIWSGDRRKEVIERIGDCPAPVCKLHRLNKSLVRMGMQPMDDKQSRAVRGFLDILTYIGDPGGVRFL